MSNESQELVAEEVAATMPVTPEPEVGAHSDAPVEVTSEGTDAPIEVAADSAVDDDDATTGPDDDATPDAEAAPTRGRRSVDLEREGEVAADFLEHLLDICDIDGDLDVDIDGDRAAVSLVDSDEGRVPRRLVGQNGAVLEALQELTRLAVQSQTGNRSRLMLDIAGHRAGRRAELVTVAGVAIEKVRNGSTREVLEPMTAFERKVVHDEVLAAGFVSESEGSEPRRFVVVLPADA